MARPGMMTHTKFKVLTRRLKMPRVHVRGHLELLWEVAYENGDPVIGDAESVAAAAEFEGESMDLVTALLECGGEGRSGFIEPVPGEPGRYRIHDLFENAPEYVQRRHRRHSQREKETTGRTESTNGRSVTGQCPTSGDHRSFTDDEKSKNGATTAPAPAPRPSQQPNTGGAEGGKSQKPGNGLYRDLQESDLLDTAKMLSWYERARMAGHVGGSDRDRLEFIATAVHARSRPAGKQIGNFVSTLKKPIADRFITNAEEQTALDEIAGLARKREPRGGLVTGAELVGSIGGVR